MFKQKASPDFVTYDEWLAVSVSDDIFLGTEPEVAGTEPSFLRLGPHGLTEVAPGGQKN